MELKIQAIHFDATQKLQEFIAKKTAKLEKSGAKKVEVTLKVVKPETALNKETGIRITMPKGELFATKTCDTFEEGIDTALEALRGQMAKYKDKEKQARR